MYNYFYPLLVLQGFCLYHAYKNRTDQKWYWLIIFFPYIGCFIYLYDAFYSRRNVGTIAEGLKQVVNSNYKIDRLEREAKFSNSTKNKIDLADAYLENGRIQEAVDMYEECSGGYMADDEPLKRKRLHALFLNNQFEKCILLGRELSGTKQFKDSYERISFASALHHEGFTDEALKHFEEMDRSFTNYDHRYAYCLFLISIGKTTEANEKLAEMIDEINHMKSLERKTHREIISSIRDLHRQQQGKR